MSYPSAGRFMTWSSQSSSYLDMVGAHGFNVWQENDLCEYTNEKGEKVTKCSPEQIATVCGRLKFFSKEAAYYDNPNHGGAKHHPTKAFHMWRGESIAYLISMTMLDAIYMIENDMKSGKTTDQLLTDYTAELKKLQPPLPPPNSCNDGGTANWKHDNLHCETMPSCYTDYAPHYNPKFTLKELIVGPSNWTEVGTEYTSFHEKGDYRDIKPHFQNEGISTEIYLKLLAGQTDRVNICGSVGESLKHTTLYLDLHAAEDPTDATKEKAGLKETYTPSANRVVWTDRHYVGNECTELVKIPKGIHVLGIGRNETVKGGHVSSVAHVIVW